MPESQPTIVRVLPIDQIAILNPRVRSPKVFRELVASIEKVGLKRPITVSKTTTNENQPYTLVCGQGRLEAYKSLKQNKIPAIVIDASRDECFVMSLVENMARRQRTAIEWVRDIEDLENRGNSLDEISRKTGLSEYYVRCVLRLLRKGEERLLSAVSAGTIPVTIALEISDASGPEAQRILQEAYESGAIRGKKLLAMKKLVDRRRTQGRALDGVGTQKIKPKTAKDFVRVYNEQVEKQKLLVKKAEISRSQLLFLVEGMRSALEDPRFLRLLEKEDLNTMPACLAERIGWEDELTCPIE